MLYHCGRLAAATTALRKPLVLDSAASVAGAVSVNFAF